MIQYSKRAYKKSTLKRIGNRFFSLFGYEMKKIGTTDRVQNYSSDFLELVSKNNYSEFTMLSLANQYALFQAIKYISDNNIPGDIVECGVWRGGAMMLALDTLNLLSDQSRTVWLYDTYAGMTPPTTKDIDVNGNDAQTTIEGKDRTDLYVDWCYADIIDVKKNIFSTGYPQEKINFIKGDVLETVPNNMPDEIAILRLDTDWYESTAHEMKHFYPKLTQHGVLIVDDYGTWAGSNQALNEYFIDNKPLFNRVDHTAILLIK